MPRDGTAFGPGGDVHPLEIAQVAVVAAAALRVLVPWRRHPAVLAVALLAPPIVGAAQMLVTGLRWQTGVLGVAAMLVTVAAAVDARHARGVARALAIIGGGCALAAAFAVWALPVPDLPEPSGPRPVGTTSSWLVDGERLEAWGPDPAGPRRIAVHVWYPRADGAEEASAWLPDERLAAAIASSFRLPGVLASHLADIDGHAVRDAPPADDGPFPMLVFSHGWSGLGSLHSPLFESLASHGWVVIAIDHPHAALTTVMPDGDVVGLDPSVLPDTSDEQVYAEAARALVATFAADIELAFTQHADRLDEDLVRIIDPYRVAVGGHSTGGGAAILACSRNRWCDAAIGFDPWVEPVPDDTIGAGLDVPLLSIRSAEWAELANDRRLRRLHAGTSAREGRITIDGTVHRDFTLVPLLSPLVQWTDAASRRSDAEDNLRIVEIWTRSFLDRHVIQRGFDPLRFPPDEPRVTVAPG